MYKANDVIGLPVLDLKAGEERGVVRDVLFGEDFKFEGLLVEVKAMFRRGRFIPSHNIHAIGHDYVTIEDEEMMQPIQGIDYLHGVKTGPTKVMGKPVITANGQRLGQVEDIYFQAEFGSIIGYELSDGLLSDIMEGRKAVKHVERTKIGEDAVILPITNASLMERNALNLSEGEDAI